MRTKSPSDNIPNLDNLYEVTRDYVKEHQGKQGYIDTNSELSLDLIFAITYDFFESEVHEKIVNKIRVNADDDLEIMLENCDEWDSVRWSDNIYFIPTIFSIAESIEEYVEEEED